MPPEPCTDEFARAQLTDLKSTVAQHRQESQAAHAATAGKIDAVTSKIDQQTVVLARMEERAEAAEKARLERESASWSPQKVAVVAGSVGTLLAALGYGAPKVYQDATAHQPEPPPPATVPEREQP
jgi:uncharacterized membrane protein